MRRYDRWMWVMVSVEEAQGRAAEIMPGIEVSWWTSTVHVGMPRGMSAPAFVDETLIRNSDFGREDELQYQELVEGTVRRVLLGIDDYMTIVERTATVPAGWLSCSRNLKETRRWFDVETVFDVPCGLGPCCFLIEVR